MAQKISSYKSINRARSGFKAIVILATSLIFQLSCNTVLASTNLLSDVNQSESDAKSLQYGKFRISEEVKKEYPTLIKLILNTESMDDKERQYWFDTLPTMTKSQAERLYQILETEKQKLMELEERYSLEIKALIYLHTAEWENLKGNAQLGDKYVLLTMEVYNEMLRSKSVLIRSGGHLGIGGLYEKGLGYEQDSNKAAQNYLQAYKLGKLDKNKNNEAKKALENLLVSESITDPDIRKQVEAIFAKPPLITWQTEPPSTVTSDTTTLSVLLTDNGGGIGDVRLLINGVAVDQSGRGITRQTNQTSQSFTLSLPKGTHNITVEAYPAENVGITSKVSKQITSTYAPVQKPKLHAVVIGVNDYNNPDLKLNYAVTDAKAVYNTLQQQTGGLYDAGQMTLLTSKQQTSKNSIINAIEQVKGSAKMGDVFVFYAASHGYNYLDAGYYLFTSDVGATSKQKLQESGIDAESLQDLLAQITTDKKLILLDTCDSGGALDATSLIASRGMDDQMVIERMNRKAGATVLMASSSQQKAMEGYQGHGLFTYGLLQGLQGQADYDKNSYASTDELKMYLESQIPVLAQQAFNQPQYPKASITGESFEFKVVR